MLILIIFLFAHFVTIFFFVFFNFCYSSQKQEEQEIFVASSPVVQVESRRSLAARHRIPRFDLVQGLDHWQIGFDLVGNHWIEETFGTQTFLLV